MILISFGIGFVYFVLIASFIYGIQKNNTVNIEGYNPESKLSVIIPFRNESNNLRTLIASISKLDYPNDLFEVLLIDDHSNDDSYGIAFEASKQHPNFKLLSASRESKKEALKEAISVAKHDWILTTDADCKLPVHWLKSFDAFLQKNDAKMIAGPVAYEANYSFLEAFQSLDFMSLMGTTMGSFGHKKPFLCNGANLCYLKEAFTAVNGFEGNTHIASGDDIFLLNKFSEKYPNQLYFLHTNEAIVTTYPQKNLQDLISQRRRWSAKTTATKSNLTKVIGLVVLTTNFLFIYLLFCINEHLLPTILFIGLKALIDYCLIRQVALFLDQTRSLNYYLPSMIVYPFFNVLIAFSSLIKGYSWKGRYSKK